MATVIGGPWPEHLNSPANTYYQARPVITMTSSLVTTHWGRVPSVHRIYYPVLAWPIQFRAYAMPSVPVPPITLLTDMVTRSRLLAAHGLTSCLSVRTQPLTATGAPSQTSTIPYHTIQRGFFRHIAIKQTTATMDVCGYVAAEPRIAPHEKSVKLVFKKKRQFKVHFEPGSRWTGQRAACWCAPTHTRTTM